MQSIQAEVQIHSAVPTLMPVTILVVRLTNVDVIYVREADYMCSRMAKCDNTAVSTPATLSGVLIFETPPTNNNNNNNNFCDTYSMQ
jgi:hypothetical protein